MQHLLRLQVSRHPATVRSVLLYFSARPKESKKWGLRVYPISPVIEPNLQLEQELELGWLQEQLPGLQEAWPCYVATANGLVKLRN